LTWEYYLSHILPYWLHITKGYGFTVDDINWSCRADLDPYEKAHNISLEEMDTYIYTVCGRYIVSAVTVSVEHCLAGRKAQSKYIDEPIYEVVKAKQPLTEEEKQREVDLFFARENARRVNWRRNHYKKEG
jgi:hypothetical protein